MTPEAKQLTNEVYELERALTAAKERLQRYIANCKHVFSDPIYDPIVTGGYMSLGDPPGTMGVDRQLPMYIPRNETPKWKRTCKLCGKVETTTNVEEHVTKKPKF